MVHFSVLVLPLFFAAVAAQSGTGQTTRYWDCCKPSCGWPGKASLKQGPVRSCSASNQPLNDQGNTQSGCNGGGAYTCGDQQPWAVNSSVAYGFAAAKLANAGEGDWCCACYELTFTSGPVQGKKMVVQVTNTGGDLGNNHFDLMASMPGGGVGIFNGCSAQWNAPAGGWGAQYGGVSNRADCDQLPAAIRPGCQWRFDWFQDADNPTVSFRKVSCPAEITAKTGCIRSDDSAAVQPPAAGCRQ